MVLPAYFQKDFYDFPVTQVHAVKRAQGNGRISQTGRFDIAKT
jgi:hypothetical protein